MNRSILLLLAAFPAVSFAGTTKVDICHATGSGSSHIISVSESALPAHLAHGDNIVSDEVCDDGIDNDCDGVVDGDNAIDAPTWYADADEDGYGDPADGIHTCEQPDGYVDNAEDPDDSDPYAYPGAPTQASALAEGDLVISEIMQNPSMVLDEDGEWFEVYNNTTEIVDLYGLRVMDDGTGAFVVGDHLLLDPGDYAVFATDDDEANNGGLTVD